ncbi:helix-turn-helix domain-containing protein [Tenacibaculum amylolyticum]|uniref:helix-turn-helix domain-containing protein n=1 Tax=Tenacibaculum amylolyticum TaxID=104269 RepID=UPI003895A0E8
MPLEKLTYIINSLIFTQAFIFGLRFIFTKNDFKPTFFLGFFIIVISLPSATAFFQMLGIKINTTLNLHFLTHLLFLAIPFFYFHIRQVLKLPIKRRHYSLLLFGNLFVLIFLCSYIENQLTEPKLSKQFCRFSYLFGIIVNTFLLIKIIQLVNYHFEKIKPTITFLEKRKKIVYLVQLTIRLLVILLYPILLSFNQHIIYYNLFISIVIASLLYWFIFQGENPRKTILLLVKGNAQKPIHNHIEKHSTVALNQEKQEDLHNVFIITHAYLQNSKAYKNSELMLYDISSATNIAPQKILDAIHSIKKESFKSYINKLRIQELISLLHDTNFKHYTMEALSAEVGFKSRSTFYRVFKQEMHCSPTDYRLKDLE